LAIPVKLPKEVLNLFPTWEYRCPDCGTYVESNISFCPNCKTAFDEKSWRVPPRFLKSHEAMSEYAHKVLAPKLTPKQRERLFQYFTELFSDGFESGDFSAWDGTSVDTGCSISVVDTQQHCGTYGAEAYLGGLNEFDYAYCYKNISATNPLYLRVYFRLNELPPSGKGANIIKIANQTNGDLAILEVHEDGAGGQNLRMRFYRGWTDSRSASISVSAGTWYYMELMAYINSSGEYKGYFEGEEKCSWSGNNTGRGTPDQIQVGLVRDNQADYEHTVWVDCVVVADTYIGPETTEQTYTKTWTTDTLFKKLGIAKALSVDTVFQKRNIPKTFGLDSTFQKSFVNQKQVDALFKKFHILKSFAVDVRFGALMTQTVSRQIDVLLKKLDASKTFGLDAYFGPVEAQAYAKTFALDVVFAYKVRLPELWLDENGKLVLNISKPYTWVGT